MLTWNAGAQAITGYTADEVLGRHFSMFFTPQDLAADLPSAEMETAAHAGSMLSDHRKDVSEFKKMSESAKDSDVKAFAGKTLPTLQEHLKMAQSVNDSVKSMK